MDKFPFSKDEWDELIAISCDMANEVFRYDNVSPELFSNFRSKIKKLINKYGKHPLLLETLANHSDDLEERKKLYSEALDLAVKFGLPTLTIRISFARLYSEDIEDDSKAIQILEPAMKEIEDHDDENDLEEYFDLKRKITIKACN